jgi:hypothetical protein
VRDGSVGCCGGWGVRGGGLCMRRWGHDRGADAVLALSPRPRGIIEAPSASATWRTPARIKGQHGAELNLAVLPRRRAPHRSGQHACRTSILPRAGFVYATPAMTGRPRWGLAVGSCACGAAAKSSCAAAATAGRSTATAIAPDRHAARRCTERADAGSELRGVGGCMLPIRPTEQHAD